MPKLIVHIGMPKTGSTSLQETLGLSRAILRERGVLFPRTWRTNNHRVSQAYLAGPAFAHPLDRNAFDNNEDRILNDGKIAWNLVQEDIASFDGNLIILSSESFAGLGRTSALSELLEHFNRISIDITFVCYLRSPDSYYLSLYQQRLKNFGPERPEFSLAIVRSRLGGFVAAYGDAVQAQSFDRRHLRDGDVVTDFAQRYLGSEIATALLRPSKNSNTSVSPEAMVLFEAFHAGELYGTKPIQSDEIVKFRKQLQYIDGTTPGLAKPRYKPGVARAVYDKINDAPWIEEHFGLIFERPDDGGVKIADVESLRGVRDFCEVDEDRYEQLRNQLLEWNAQQVVGNKNQEQPITTNQKPSRSIDEQSLLSRFGRADPPKKPLPDSNGQVVKQWIKKSPQRFRRNVLRILGVLGLHKKY